MFCLDDICDRDTFGLRHLAIGIANVCALTCVRAAKYVEVAVNASGIYALKQRGNVQMLVFVGSPYSSVGGRSSKPARANSLGLLML